MFLILFRLAKNIKKYYLHFMAKLKKRNITKKSLIYSIGTIVSSISTLILIPIYSKYLTPSDYGNYELAFSLTFLLVIFSYLFYTKWIS